MINKLVALGADSSATAYNGDNMLHYTTDAQIIKNFSFLSQRKNCLGKIYFLPNIP